MNCIHLAEDRIQCSCEHSHEPLESKDGEVLDQLDDIMLLKKDSASWSWIS